MKDKHERSTSVKKFHSPIPRGVTTRIVYPTGKYAHEKHPVMKYAKDFVVVPGTQVEAMEGGRVVYVKSDSDKYGLDEKYANEANTIAIKHNDGTALEYIHFGQDQIYFKEGEEVKTGQVLGLSGWSGCMDTPHVHVNRFKVKKGKAISLPYDVKGVKDERATDRGSGGGLEKITGGMFIVSVGIALLFFSGITGNIVGVTNNGFYGLIFVFMSLVFGGVWIYLRKRAS